MDELTSIINDTENMTDKTISDIIKDVNGIAGLVNSISVRILKRFALSRRRDVDS